MACVTDHDKLGAVVVTYSPEGDYNNRILMICKQFPHVVVVDNSIDDIKFSDMLLDRVTLIKNSKNLGIAKAINQGISHLADKGYEWVACFDQDTLINDNYLATISKAIMEAGYKECICGSSFKENRLASWTESKKSYKHCKTVITSGSMFPISLWHKLEKFNESYFIDSVDHEFCLKARSKKYPVIKSTIINIEHEIGTKNHPKGFGFVPVHPPIRKYYIARNVILTVKQFFSREPLWCLKQFARLFIEFFSVVLIETGKTEKLQFFFLGLAHGLTGRKGSYLDE